MTPNQIEQERQLFEAWQQEQNNKDRLSFHYSNDELSGIEYKDISINYAWQGWLAAKIQAAQSGWIAVSDRLPEDDESFDGLLGSSKKFYVYAKFVTHWRVMKFHRSRNPDTGEYAWTDNVMYKNSKVILSESSVSHWQPEIFPEPPKTK